MNEKNERPTCTKELFYSYADADEDLRSELDKHLSLLQRESLIVTFHKRLISPGTDWTTTLDQHLNTASVILLLISADFIASDYCYGTEMQRAMERHHAGEARVIPILLRPLAIDWQNAPFGKLKALPSNGRPVTSWPNRDEAFAEIGQSIRSTLQEVQRQARPLEATKPCNTNSHSEEQSASEPTNQPMSEVDPAKIASLNPNWYYKTIILCLPLVCLVALGLTVAFYPTIVSQIENSFLRTVTPTSSGPTSVVELFVVLGLILLITVTINPMIDFFKRHRHIKK